MSHDVPEEKIRKLFLWSSRWLDHTFSSPQNFVSRCKPTIESTLPSGLKVFTEPSWTAVPCTSAWRLGTEGRGNGAVGMRYFFTLSRPTWTTADANDILRTDDMLECAFSSMTSYSDPYNYNYWYNNWNKNQARLNSPKNQLCIRMPLTPLPFSWCPLGSRPSDRVSLSHDQASICSV